MPFSLSTFKIHLYRLDDSEAHRLNTKEQSNLFTSPLSIFSEDQNTYLSTSTQDILLSSSLVGEASLSLHSLFECCRHSIDQYGEKETLRLNINKAPRQKIILSKPTFTNTETDVISPINSHSQSNTTTFSTPILSDHLITSSLSKNEPIQTLDISIDLIPSNLSHLDQHLASAGLDAYSNSHSLNAARNILTPPKNERERFYRLRLFCQYYFSNPFNIILLLVSISLFFFTIYALYDRQQVDNKLRLEQQKNVFNSIQNINNVVKFNQTQN
jgi:hypothetical protein